MLSPASLRVCCLAVMAPALTKADRRADCLPVVLPFCMSKTADSENRKDRINELSLSKLPNKFTSLLNKRKHLMNKAWFRTYIRNNSELSDRNRYMQFDLRKSLLHSKIRLNAETKIKSWHGTNVTLAVADKVRQKYTMNKSNNSLKNMGLARANTSLGLHSMKKMHRNSQLTHRDKGNPSNFTQESTELTPDLPVSTSSELETTFRIVKIVQPVQQGQSTREVSSPGDSACDSAHSVAENKPMSIVHNSSSDQGVNVSISNDSNTPPLSISPNDTIVSLSESNLSVTLTDSNCLLNSKRSLDSNFTKAFLPVSNSNKQSSAIEETSVKSVEPNDISPVQEDSIKLSQHLNQDSVPNVLATKESKLHDSSVDHLNCVTPLPSPVCDVPVQEDIVGIGVSLEDKTPFSPCSPSRFSFDGSDDESGNCTSSTLSADESPLPSSLEDGSEKVFITFPDSFLATPSRDYKELAAPAFLDSCFTFNSLDSFASDHGMHLKRNACCPLPEKDQSYFNELLLEQHEKITVALEETEFLLRKYMVQHVQEQIRALVQHFQKKLNVTCQRQTKSSGSKSTRDLVDLKAELLQSENVKNLSTAALVNLVRNIGSNASTGSILPLQNAPPQDSELPRKSALQTIPPEDFADVKHTSKVLLKNVKKLLRFADPDLTESSDEESSDTERDDESAENPVQKKALWKFVKERAALASRSTLLISKIRELENQLQTMSNCKKNMNSSYEKISFEDQLVSEIADDTSLQATLKLGRPKGLGRPLNGYLDHSSVSSTIHAGTTANKSEALHLEQKPNNFITIDDSESCMRTRPIKTSNFLKRKLIVTTGLHLTNPKLAKLSTVSCVCNSQEEMLPCVLCTGRYNCIQSVDPDSLPLLDRVALLDPSFHPLLSFEKDIPLLVHFENILKKNEAQYQTVRPISPTPSHRSFGTKPKLLTDAKSRSRKLKRYARSLLSAKYQDKKKNFHKHKLVFGKWRKLQSKSSFHARNRLRRYSVASSCSSHDSPVPSPLSVFDDGSGFDAKRKRDDNQYDIDNVIIPYGNKRGRLVKFEFKDIEIPSWRSIEFEDLKSIEMEEDTSETAYVIRHENYEVEERKIIRNGGGALGFFNTWQKRARRQHRSDSRADSSGANTPDPVLMCDQDILFQDTNSMNASSPLSPALSPPATPSSANIISDDSQSALGNMKKKVLGVKKSDEVTLFRASSADYDEIPPYESRTFPLPDETIEDLLAEADHNRDDTDVTASGPSCPASPVSTTSSTSTVEEEEDITDPEWRVVRRESGPEQALVLKFAKR